MRLFRAVGEQVPAQRVLYPGSYVDVAASFAFPRATYVDVDSRAAAFFADRQGVLELIKAHPGSPADPVVEFVHGDYSDVLAIPDGGFDLLISMYAGFVSESCTRYLRVGGTLLVNPSHGDAAKRRWIPAIGCPGSSRHVRVSIWSRPRTSRPTCGPRSRRRSPRLNCADPDEVSPTPPRIRVPVRADSSAPRRGSGRRSCAELIQTDPLRAHRGHRRSPLLTVRPATASIPLPHQYSTISLQRTFWCDG